MRKRNRKRSRAGFTLMEILLVAAILVIIASMATIGVLAMQKSAVSKLALNEIKTMEQACIQFKINMQSFPAKLEDLFIPPQSVNRTQWGGPYLDNGDILDPWGQEYVYTPNDATDQVLISSNGPDQQPGTEDDVSNRPTAQGQGT